jgi:hypothetical protein
MKHDFREAKPDGIVAFQSILYSANNKNIIGNAFLNTDVGIFIMYNEKGDLIDYVIEKVKKE